MKNLLILTICFAGNEDKIEFLDLTHKKILYSLSGFRQFGGRIVMGLSAIISKQENKPFNIKI